MLFERLISSESISNRISRKSDINFHQKVMSNLDIEDARKNLPISSNNEIKDKTIESLARLSFELKDKMPRYQTIIGDDASGRLIALYLREQINEKRTRLRKKPVQTYFLRGGKSLTFEEKDAVKNFISQRKDQFGKTLLVTELISSGNGIYNLFRELTDQKVDCDLASLVVLDGFFANSLDPEDYDEKVVSELKKRLMYGTHCYLPMEVFYQKNYNGVRKRPITNNNGFLAHAEKFHEDQKGINRIRYGIRNIARSVSKLI